MRRSSRSSVHGNEVIIVPYVYRYVDKKDGEVKYIGIINNDSNFPQRFNQHINDEWNDKGEWSIEYIEVNSRTDAEALEAHFIWFYGTGEYFNKAKTNWGACSFVPDPDEYEWVEYSGEIIQKKKKTKKRMKRRDKERFQTTRRILFGKGKAAIERETGITRRTQLNWERDPTTMNAQGMARIIKARGLSEDEIMLVLKDLAM